MSSLGRYSSNRLRRLIGSVGSIRFRDEIGEVEYFGQQVVMLRKDAIKLIRDELMRIGGAAGNVTMLTAGFISGREEARVILAKAKALGVKPSEILPAPVLTAVEETNMGYGKIRIDNINFGSWTFNISVLNSFEVDQSGHSQKPTCVFILSYLKGLLSELAGKDLGGEEFECKSKGDPQCRFRLAVENKSESARAASESDRETGHGEFLRKRADEGSSPIRRHNNRAAPA
jgi:predicted hydrocarbon binding protein